MSQTLLQVNFTFTTSRAELEAAWLDIAQSIADVSGLRWKVWLMNEAHRQAGGLYLFDSATAAQTYLDGPIVAALKASPSISNVSAKLFDVLESHSATTWHGLHLQARGKTPTLFRRVCRVHPAWSVLALPRRLSGQDPL